MKFEAPKTDYSEIAHYYDKVRNTSIDPWLSKIIDYGRIDTNCSVLDVGCGTGRFTLGLSAVKNLMVCGLEPSIEMLKQAAKKDSSKHVLWVRGDGQRLPFRSETFNCIYMTMVIHHLQNKVAALREIYRTLKTGGKCVIMTVSHSRIKEYILHDFPGIAVMDLKRFPTVPSIRRTMIDIGFKDVHYHVVQHGEGYISADECLEKVRNKYISTLTLLDEEAFQKGFKIFKKRVRKKYGTKIKWTNKFNFVVGQK
ncbi:MAG: class I SAM-dependent methyltransferase [Candidatus Bathyarchaeia archaeon]